MTWTLFFGPFLTHFSRIFRLYATAHAPWDTPGLVSMRHRMLIGACDPMLCPIRGFRAPGWPVVPRVRAHTSFSLSLLAGACLLRWGFDPLNMPPPSPLAGDRLHLRVLPPSWVAAVLGANGHTIEP